MWFSPAIGSILNTGMDRWRKNLKIYLPLAIETGPYAPILTVLDGLNEIWIMRNREEVRLGTGWTFPCRHDLVRR